jgi:hypothetical protein
LEPGEDSRAPARLAAAASNLPYKVAAVTTINEVFKMLCTAAIAGLIMIDRELIPGVCL